MQGRKVVVVGGGFGGVRAALELCRRKKDLHITLIDKNNYHSYTPDYYEAATAALSEPAGLSVQSRDFLELKSSVAIPFGLIFKKYKNFSFLRAEATKIDFGNKKVITASGESIFYDFLILALGSVSNFFGIPRLKELAFELKTVNNALNIRNALDEAISRTPKNRRVDIVIGGGGFTGCELAGELIGYVKKLSKIHGRPKDSVKCLIVEGSDNILGGAGQWIQKRAEKRLKKLGIKIKNNYCIKEVSEKEVKDQGETIGYDFLVWTAGVKANDFSSALNLPLEKSGALKVDEYFRPKGFKNIFALGDMAYKFDPKTHKSAPMTAQTAIKQGKYAALAVLGEIQNKKPKKYVYKGNPFIIPLGGRYALADLGWLKMEGILGWMMRSLAALRYFLTILPFFQAVKIWLLGRVIYLKND